MSTNNVLLSTFIHAGVPIPLSGDSVVAEAVVDPSVMVQDGLYQAVYSTMINPKITVTITCYPQDPAHRVLMGLYQTQRAAQGLVQSPGRMVGSDGIAYSYARGQITQLPPLRREQAASTVSWTIIGDGVTVTL